MSSISTSSYDIVSSFSSPCVPFRSLCWCPDSDRAIRVPGLPLPNMRTIIYMSIYIYIYIYFFFFLFKT